MEPRENERDRCYRREATTRYATVVLDPGPEGFYPESRLLLEQADVTRERVHHVDVLDDGTIVGLYELHCDADSLRSGLRYIPHVRSYHITGTDPVFLYLHEDGTEPARTLLEELRSSPVVVDQPFEYQPDGSLRLTMIGEDDVLGRTFESLGDVVDVHLEETGEYRPELDDLSSLLTGRQRQVLEAAVDLGYYEVPRQVTHQDVAAECGCSQSTVAEHLQKIEAAVLPHAIR